MGLIEQYSYTQLMFSLFPQHHSYQRICTAFEAYVHHSSTVQFSPFQLTSFYRNANLQLLYRLCTFCKYFSPHDGALYLKTCSYMLRILSFSSFKQQGFPSLRSSIIKCSSLYHKETSSFYTGFALSANISHHMTELSDLKHVHICFEYYLSVPSNSKDFPL